LILAVHPLSLFDIGFQLSFAGVLAILYAHRLLRPPTAPDLEAEAPVSLAARLQRKLHEAVLISVCASIGTAPLVVYYFQRLPLIAPLANIAVVPLASLMVPLALVASCIGQLVPPLGDLLLSLVDMLVTAMYMLLRQMVGIPYAAPRLGGVSLPLIVLAYGLFLLLPSARVSRLCRWGVAGGSLVLVLWSAWPALIPDGRGELQVTFLDVGHGDASFIRFPQGTTMLIDGGGSARGDFDVGERVVAPFLWHKRVRTVDYVVATHSHPDHAKGLPFILKYFRVRQFWDNGATLHSPWYTMLREQAVGGGLYRDVVSAGLARVSIDGVRLDVLHPTLAFQSQAQLGARTPEDRGENNRSLVLKLGYGDVSVLFTGDIEQEAEAFLLQTGCDVGATVLKVPHHGSRTSSSEAFVRAVNPRVAVFSVQRDSRFGHPHAMVVERYQASGAHVLRTDAHGAISLRTDGQSLWVEPFIGQPAVLPSAAPHQLVETVPSSPSVAPR
jgi:competence protein ComEC